MLSYEPVAAVLTQRGVVPSPGHIAEVPDASDLSKLHFKDSGVLQVSGPDRRGLILGDGRRGVKQLNRKRRELEKAGNRDELKEHRRLQLRYELSLYKERCERYPTDLRLKFDYAKRLFAAGRADDAIPMLQAARSDPKNRAAAGLYIGRCFLRKGFFDQSIAAYKDAMADHEFDDDELALKLRYWLGRTYEQGKMIDDARKMFGEVLQRDYNYRDVRVRMEALSRDSD